MTPCREHLTLDRIEGEWAVCILDDKTTRTLPCKVLPPGTRVQDVLYLQNGNLHRDEAETQRRREEASKALAALWEGPRREYPMRRTDREITDMPTITAMLDRVQVIRLGLTDGTEPYIVPLHFGYTMANGQLVLYVHGAKSGRKQEILAKNNKICFEADYLHDIVKPADPAKWTSHYESVIGFGIIEEVTDAQERYEGLASILQKCGYKGAPELPPEAQQGVLVSRITVSQVTGKANLPTK